jgi:hypothetical protein
VWLGWLAGICEAHVLSPGFVRLQREFCGQRLNNANESAQTGLETTQTMKRAKSSPLRLDLQTLGALWPLHTMAMSRARRPA